MYELIKESINSDESALELAKSKKDLKLLLEPVHQI